jgi:tyrosyl-tRNA synthetase
MSDLLTRSVAKVIPKDLAEAKVKSGKKMRLYWGIDPTGARIHVGHAVNLRKMKQFVDEGHEVIFLVGSFTAMIGDPTDRAALRQPITAEDVRKNFETYKEQASKILDFSKVQVKYNHEWLEKLGFSEILGLAGNFTVQQMMQRDMFEKRMKEGKDIGLHEFLYPLMVGYDSVVLDVDVELGGTDQEFNMLAGRTLQKAFGKREKFVMTVKLLEGTDGRKMSKSYDNCIYLDDAPNDMFGKVMSVKDDLMEQYFELCTDVDMAEAKSLLKGDPRDAKMRLAKEIVTLYHGSTAADAAAYNFENVFGNGGVPDDIPEVSVKDGETLLDVLAREKLIASKSDGRRLIDQGAITIDGENVTEIHAPAVPGVVKVGKRKFLRLI